MYRTNFSKNWNNKLLLDNFGTVRLPDDKFFQDAVHEISLNNEVVGLAKIYTIRRFRFADIRDALGWLDSGMPAVKLAAMLKTMYKNKLEGGVQSETVFVHVIFHWQSRNKKAFDEMANTWYMNIQDSFYESTNEMLAL